MTGVGTQTRDPLRFEDAFSGHFVELRLGPFDDDEPGTDLLVIACVQTSGFTAEVDCWILRPAWESFCRELAQLEQVRQGSASLEAISPDELKLSVHSTNRAGQMAIAGLIGTDMSDSSVRMTFSPVPFDPSTLPELVRIAHSWTATLAAPKKKWNPPVKCGEWRGLSEEEKWTWLESVRDHHFASAAKGAGSPHRSGQTFTIDGEWIEDVASFFCVMGEAVNGPGGYFGANMMAFDDALCGGFGLDAPSTIRWSNSTKSKLALDSIALARNLKRDAKWERKHHSYDPSHPDNIGFLVYNQGEPEYLELLRLAEAGTRTMFEQIIEMIEFRSTNVEIRLLLE